MAISITPEQLQAKPPKPSFFSIKTGGGALFMASFLLFLASAGGWIGLRGFGAKLEQDVFEAEQERLQVRRSRQPKIEAEIFSTISRLNHLETLLNRHRDGRVALKVLQDRVQPGVVFSTFTADYESGTITMRVKAPSYAAFAQQMKAFQNDSRVASVRTESLSRPTGEFVEGGVSLTLVKDAFLVSKQGE